MKTKHIFFLIFVLALSLNVSRISAQPLSSYYFKVVNMMPHAQSDETFFDSETNIAVNPANTQMIVGTAFTPNPTGATSSAPIYVSTDRGNTWTLNNIVPSNNGMTGDISVAFATTGGRLYAGILKGGDWLRCALLRTDDPTSGTMMTSLLDRSSESIDQPWISAITASYGTSGSKDRLFAGDNNYGNSGVTYKTAEVMVSNDAASAPPSGIATRVIEERTTYLQDFPAIRTAIHSSGVVYAVYYRWTSGNQPSSERCDVVVARDDHFGTTSPYFQGIIDSDTKPGKIVVSDRLVPAFGISLGNNRLVGSNLAIAVDPENAANVIIAWCDRISTNDYTVHFRRSSTSGTTWDATDWLSVTNATNPGIAIASDGKVGLMYQQLTGTGATANWETHFRFSEFSGTTFTDDILSIFPDNDLAASTISPALGDYLRIEAVGSHFYGVFPAGNRPDNANFPQLVTYNRNADFATHQLRNLANTANVNVSVDPFFFHIYPRILNICKLYPKICEKRFIVDDICRFFPYPCGPCPWPCLSCPPFEIPIEEIIEVVYPEKLPETVLNNPYFHLTFEGMRAADYEMGIVNEQGQAIRSEVNQTDRGTVISFHPTSKNYVRGKGLNGLKLTVLPKNEKAAKTERSFKFNMQVSDYHFKEFMASRNN